MSKKLTFENGDVRDDDHCDHSVLDRPGANPICWRCGEVMEDDDDE